MDQHGSKPSADDLTADTAEYPIVDANVITRVSHDDYDKVLLPALTRRRGLFGRTVIVDAPEREILVHPAISSAGRRFLLRIRDELDEEDTRVDYMHRRIWVAPAKQVVPMILGALLLTAVIVWLLQVVAVSYWVIVAVVFGLVIMTLVVVYFSQVEWLYTYLVLMDTAIADYYKPPFPFPGGYAYRIDLSRVVNQGSEKPTVLSRVLRRLGYNYYGDLLVDTAGEGKADQHFNRVSHVINMTEVTRLIARNARVFVARMSRQGSYRP